MPEGIPVYLTRKQAADLLSLSVYTMAGWATKGRGPKFVHAGRKTLYRLEDLQAWLADAEKAA